MSREILFRERYGIRGEETVYIKPPDQNVVVRVGSSRKLHKSMYHGVNNILRQVFLPQGYPESVSADYKNYQIWDTVQAFCSTISGALTTQAIMKGVGVGDSVATPLGAAVTWILKDGTGMVGRIAFAWWKGTYLDADSKKWRLFADFLNDIAMFIELLLPYFTGFSMHILCISTSMKAIVGVAGGATRAAITQHQAIRENMADVSAKDGSQETFVNLTASMIGIAILSLCTKEVIMWYFFFAFTCLHLYANYKAVKSLKLVTLNPGRMCLVLQTYLTKEVIQNPDIINDCESVFLGKGVTARKLCGHQIILGASLNNILSSDIISAEDMKLHANLYRRRKYLLIVDTSKKIIYITLQKGVMAVDVIEAYFHAVLLGICTSMYSNVRLPALDGKGLHQNQCLLQRLKGLLNAFNCGSGKGNLRIPLEAVMTTDDIVSREFSLFLPALQAKGWSVGSHHLMVDEWRGEWTPQKEPSYETITKKIP